MCELPGTKLPILTRNIGQIREVERPVFTGVLGSRLMKSPRWLSALLAVTFIAVIGSDWAGAQATTGEITG